MRDGDERTARRVIFRGEDGAFREGTEIVASLEARTLPEVIPLFRELEAASRAGLYAAGFVAYEGASAFAPDLTTHPPVEGLPVAWFLLFRGVRPWRPHGGGGGITPFPLTMDQEGYHRAVQEIRDAIAGGEIYQANFTITGVAPLEGDPIHLFSLLSRNQPTPYGIFLDTGRHAVVSASPELFFERRGERVTTRPMKGTRRRGWYPEEDRRILYQFAADPKERAENLMIVDLLRNDLAKIARPGTVRVDSLFDVERLPAIFQMTSTVSAGVDPQTPLVEIFQALFPCGSVTGAPKRRAMEIIARLEPSPRGVYCGAVGIVHPGGGCRFAVPIRTVVVDQLERRALLGLGSGITWGSDPAREWEEVVAKGEFTLSPPTGLIESLRREGGSYPLLKLHLQRLRWSAERLGIPLDEGRVREMLERHPAVADREKVRLHLSPDGELRVTSEPVDEGERALTITTHPLPPGLGGGNLFLKSDDRHLFDEILRSHPGWDDVILVNGRGELTQGCWNSIVVRLDGAEWTPPISSGLLPGVMRRYLLERGEIGERRLTPEDLLRSEGIWLINAVRGRRPAVYIPER